MGQAFNLFSMKTSVFNLLLMTVDRFTSITRPLMSRVYRTKYNTLTSIIVCSLYTIIWRHVRQRRRKMSSFREGQDMVMEIKRSKRRLVTQKATRTIAIIVLVFIVTCLPNTMMLIVFMLTRQTSTSLLVMHSIGQGLQCLNSTLNPLCYALSNPAFRSSFKLMFSGSQKQQRMRMRNISFSTGG